MSLAEYDFWISWKRMKLVAAHGDFWETIRELYAYEAQHLWSAVGHSTFKTRVRV